jgi:site-specific recombinase XerD
MDIELAAQKFYAYSSYIKGYSKATIRRYRYVIDFYRKQSGIRRVEDISDTNVRSLFLYGRVERKWSANTFLVFHKSLSIFCKWCMKEGLLNANPVTHLEKPKLDQQLPKNLTKQEALRLLEIVYNLPYSHPFLRYRNHALFSIFIFAGLRKNECLNLKFTDVDIENLTIFVRRGKGGRDRIVPMTFALAESLKRYSEERKRLNKTCPEFFTSFRLNCGYTENGLKHLTEKIYKYSRIKFTIHSLRHTFATLMLEGGCDIYSLSKMMGHSDIKTTTIYLSASVDYLKKEVMKHPLS